MRYIIADDDKGLWGHIFPEDEGDIERECRFVFDTEQEELTHLEIWRDGRWTESARSERADLEESLTQANPDALESPSSYGIGEGDAVPEWAAPTTEPEP